MTDVRTHAAENPAVDLTRNSEITHKGWSKHDTTWMLGLYGTAIGAGTLFLPINAGVGGFWPLLILAAAAIPWMLHKGVDLAVHGRDAVEMRLGHGLGLDIHEPPRVSLGRDILKTGEVVTVEPGLYYLDAGGVRIEDDVVVTKTGCKNLTKFPKFLEIP